MKPMMRNALYCWAGCDLLLPFTLQVKESTIVGEDIWLNDDQACQDLPKAIEEYANKSELPPPIDLYRHLPYAYKPYEYDNFTFDDVVTYVLNIYNLNTQQGERVIRDAYLVKANTFFQEKMHDSEPAFGEPVFDDRDEMFAGVANYPTIVVKDKSILHIPNNITAEWNIGKLGYEMFMDYKGQKHLMLVGDIHIIGEYNARV